MVKTPSKRHSKSGREPVTIEHAPSGSKGKASAGGKAVEGVPDGTSEVEAAAGVRRPATRIGQTHSIAEDFVATPEALQREALVDTHADSPIMHPELAPAQSSTDMLNADRTPDEQPEAPLDETPKATTPEDETARKPGRSPDELPKQFTSRTVTETPPVEQPPRPRAPGTGRLLAAAAVGGIIALCGYGILSAAGLFGGGASTELATLRGEIAELRSSLQSEDSQGLAQQIDEMRSDLASLQQTGAGGSSTELAAISQRIDQLGNELASLGQGGQGADASGLSSRIEALEQRLSGLQQEVESGGGSDSRLALAVTASSLKAAIDRGEAFQAELDAYAQAAGSETPDVIALRELAPSGVPTRAAIAQELPSVATAMVDAAQPEPTNTGVIARLWSSASDLVEVRPVGADARGNEPGAVVARLEAAIEAGDYGRAISEYELLPQPSQSAGEAFITKVRARQTADDLVGKALADALKA